MEENIRKEKVEFLKSNKENLIGHFASINYMLFKVLISNKELQEMEEYNQILSVINNDSVVKTTYAEPAEIIYYLASILDKINIGSMEQSNYRNKLFNYLDYFKEDAKKFRKRKSA